MDDFNDSNPLDLIRNVYKELSRTQQRIADILLNQGYVTAFMSITDLAKIAGTTNVTIVALARRLGFSGFAELKKALQNYYKWKISPRTGTPTNLPERIDAIVDKNLQDILAKAIDSETQLLSNTFKSINRENILQAVDFISKARKIFLVAGGIVKPIAEMLQQRLNALRLNTVQVVIDNFSMIPAILEMAGPDDVFIVFSFPHYRMLIGGIAQCARVRESKVICITDSPTSPPAPYSDILLICNSASLTFYNSMTAVVSVANVIVTLLMVKARGYLHHDEEILKILSSYMTSIPYFSDIKSLPLEQYKTD